MRGGTHVPSPPSNRSEIHLKTQTGQKTNSRSQNYRRSKRIHLFVARSFQPRSLFFVLFFSFFGVGRCAAQSQGLRSTKVKWVYSEIGRQLSAPPSFPNLLRAIYLWTPSTFLKIASTIRFPNCTALSRPLPRALSLHYFSSSSSSCTPCFTATFLCAIALSL